MNLLLILLFFLLLVVLFHKQFFNCDLFNRESRLYFVQTIILDNLVSFLHNKDNGTLYKVGL